MLGAANCLFMQNGTRCQAESADQWEKSHAPTYLHHLFRRSIWPVFLVELASLLIKEKSVLLTLYNNILPIEGKNIATKRLGMLIA